jgi:hypothetical protein
MERAVAISNHHGDVQRPNELVRAKLVERHWGHEIDMYEIDFVSYHGRLLSAHDYDVDQMTRGSPLEEWLDFVVAERRKILWLDVKENLAIYMACGFAQFDCAALFQTLAHKRDQFINATGGALDLTDYVIIGCQEPALHARIVAKNRRLARRHHYSWRMILDAPSVASYYWQYVLPSFLKPWLRDWMCQDFARSNYRHYAVISIDQSFFESRAEILDFIRSLRLGGSGTMIIVNSYARSEPRLQLDDHHIVMQYDYTSEGLR